MFKPNLKLYTILVVILIILFILVAVFPDRKRKEEQIQKPIIPTPTTFQFLPTPTIIHPTSTGGSEEMPPETLNLATQKQNLKKKTPLKEANFTVEYDYNTDNFIVALSVPKDANRQVFENWLKVNYPAIPLDRFILK